MLFWFPGYALAYVPSIELQDAIPDIVPYGNSTDHVAFAALYIIPFSFPATDGSKIMAVVSFVIPMDIGIQFAKQTC